jgi:ABC-2 type transport system permease protein
VTAPARLSATDIPNGRTASRPVPSLVTRATDLLASEWTKFRSVRSTYWTLLVALVTPIRFSALVATAFAGQPASAGPPWPLSLTQNFS